MTASGPFALGPALAGQAGVRRTAPRANFTPVMPGGAGRSALGSSLTNTTAPSIGLKREPNALNVLNGEETEIDNEGEAYSDPDEGVEIIDMENVCGMDWMAPESLRREKEKKKGKKRLKKEEVDKKGKAVAKPQVEEPESAPGAHSITDVDEDDAEGKVKVNLANALNLSDSEEEEELENIIQDFAEAMHMDVVSSSCLPLFIQSIIQIHDQDGAATHNRLYFFQFPNPFPQFFSPTAGSSKEKGTESADPTEKKVSFAQDTKSAATSTPAVPPQGAAKKPEEESEEKVEGVIGQLEVYESGAVKMRLTNGIVMDVSPFCEIVLVVYPRPD